jgi:hypothetical protein
MTHVSELLLSGKDSSYGRELPTSEKYDIATTSVVDSARHLSGSGRHQQFVPLAWWGTSMVLSRGN